MLLPFLLEFVSHDDKSQQRDKNGGEGIINFLTSLKITSSGPVHYE